MEDSEWSIATKINKKFLIYAEKPYFCRRFYEDGIVRFGEWHGNKNE